MATQPPPSNRILRIGVLQNGRLLEERLFRNRDPITIGDRPRNTFVVIAPELSGSFSLFEVRGGKYLLRFTDQMTGKFVVGSSAVDLAALRAEGKAKKEGAHWVVPLDERARGKITVGDVSILFQFVVAPPLRLAPSLPAHMRGGPLLFLTNVMGLQGVFLGTLLFSAFLQGGGAWYLIERVPPPPRSNSLEDIRDRLVRLLPPAEPDEPEDDEEEAPSEVVEDEPGDAPAEVVQERQPEPVRQQPQEPQPTRTADRIRVDDTQRVQARSALESLVQGVDGGVGGPMAWSATISNASAEDIIGANSQLDTGAGGVVAGNTIGVSSGAEGGVGPVAVVEGGRGSSVAAGANVGQAEGGQRRVEVQARVRGQDVRTAGSGRIDNSALRSFLDRQSRRLQNCYQRELARTPSLRGRVLLEFTVDPGGTISEARIVNTELNDAVSNCILDEVRRWRPGAPEGGSVTVRRTYVFDASGG
jgi:TonB family protein